MIEREIRWLPWSQEGTGGGQDVDDVEVEGDGDGGDPRNDINLDMLI